MRMKRGWDSQPLVRVSIDIDQTGRVNPAFEKWWQVNSCCGVSKEDAEIIWLAGRSNGINVGLSAAGASGNAFDINRI